MGEEPKFRPAGFARPLFRAMSVLLLALLCVVAWHQLRPRKALLEKSIREQSRLVYVPACRGTLAARDGTRLNYTVPSYSIVIRPELVRDPRDTRMTTLAKLESVLASVASVLGPEYYATRPGRNAILRHLEKEPAMPLTLWEEVDAETRGRWLALRNEFPSTELTLAWKRCYDEPGLAPQLRGTTRREHPKSSLERYWNANSMELTGASGMEKALDYLLAGQGGAELLQTDVLSYRSSVLDSRPAVRGDDCRLSMDMDAQRLAEARFRDGGLKGAAVAIEMATGQVLVMASLPATPLGESGGAPGGMLNRALAGYYPPGSVIKPLYAAYAIEKGLATMEKPIVECPGFYQLTKSRRIGCSHVHGGLAIVNAISLSCNTYFCTLASSFPREQLDDFADFFGFGRKTGGDLGEQEIPGIPFSPAWVKRSRKADNTWHPGDAANAGIGQGGWIVTPMQMALATNYLLTGKLLAPRYFLKDEPKVRATHDFPEYARRIVVEGMRRCVISGTGQTLKTTRLPILAKTGTAENAPGMKPHAWVVAAAPANAPKYLVVVAVENGGGGGRIAGPIARDILLLLTGK